MLRAILKKVFRVYSVVQLGLLTLRYAGLRVALQKLGHQLYGQTVFFYTIGEMDTSVHPPRFACYSVRASSEDVLEVFAHIRSESDTGKYQLLVRKWYHEQGIGIPYVQKTVDTNEVCCIQWMLTARDIEKSGLANRFPKLEEDEFMLENVYTLERFRNKGIRVSSKMNEITLAMGLKKIRGKVAEDNYIELRALKRWGARIVERVLERHVLFRVSRKTMEHYDPPIPVTLPEEP